MTALAASQSPQPATAREILVLKVGTASIWLLTALGVLHPYYRQVGHEWLSRLGLPDALMWPTCAGELALALAILALPPKGWLMTLQMGAVGFFTLILAALDWHLLVHPFGMLSKNGPFMGLVFATWLIAREGWTSRATWLLRAAMALVWMTEGLFPKILFQQPMELAVVANSGLVPISASVFLTIMGVAQVVSGVLALLLRGRPLRWLLWAQIIGLVLLPLLVSWQDPNLWFHPFGPMTKNIPLIIGTLGVLPRCP